jgi:hypothetical protein
VYATLYYGFPNDDQTNYLWLSSFNLSGLTTDRCKTLKGRSITLYPDLSAESASFHKWNEQAHKLRKKLHGTTIKVSTMLEDYATQEQKNRGLDLADFLIQEDWKLFL